MVRVVCRKTSTWFPARPTAPASQLALEATGKTNLCPRPTRAALRCLALLIAAAFAGLPGSARAQFSETVEIEREIPSGNSLDATAAGTEIRVRERSVSQTTQDLVEQSAGTRVVGTGAEGSPFCLRLRGAACSQSTVMLGDVPLSGPDTGDFDLSLIPVEAIDGLQVFRGGAPVWLNEGAIGGVLRLLPRQSVGNELGGRVTGGSFGSWRANLFGSASAERVRAFATAGAAGSQGNYRFWDDKGTLFEPQDDEWARRSNADFIEGFGFSQLSLDTGTHSQLDALFWGVGRDRGVPGPGSAPAANARMKTTRMLGSLSWLQDKGGKHPYRLQILGNYDYGRDRFDDQQAEIGLGAPQLTDDRNHSLFGRMASSVMLMPWLELTSIATARYLLRDPEDELAAYQEQPSDRLTVSGSLEPRFFGTLGNVALELRPSVLLSWSRASIESPRPDVQAPGESSDFLPTYRVGAAIAPLPWLGFRGSVSSGFRLPDRLQLFGNRGTVLPNPSLRPEKSLEFDAAASARGHRGLFSGYLSAGWFSRHIEDQIRFRRTAQFAVVAENIDSGRTRGAEVELRASISCYFMLDAELTWIDAIDESTGNQIPGQPSWLALARPAVHSGPLRAHLSDLFTFFEINYVGDSYADPANLVAIQSRTVLSLGVGAELFEGALGLGVRADDLLDVRGEDLLGFPLPGLRFSGRVSYRYAW